MSDALLTEAATALRTAHDCAIHEAKVDAQIARRWKELAEALLDRRHPVETPAEPSEEVIYTATQLAKILREKFMARMPDELRLALEAFESALAGQEQT